MKPQTKIKKVAGLILAWAMLSGCLTVQTAYDFDESVDFSSLKTYKIQEKALARLNLNDLDKPRLIRAVKNEIEKIGFSPSDKPDVLIAVQVLQKDATKTDGGYVGGGYVYDYTTLEYRWTASQWNSNAATKHVTESIIVVDFVDPDTNKLIWHGRFTGFNFDDFKLREIRLQEAVRKIIIQYRLQLKAKRIASSDSTC
jgi:hypothetical protein